MRPVCGGLLCATVAQGRNKTKLLKTDATQVTLITRPRRFGKTLSMSMMAEFFDIREDNCALFEDNLDLSMEDPVRKEIPSDFDSYIAEYVHFAATENKTSKMYSVMDHNTTVMHCIADLTADIIQQGNKAADETLPQSCQTV